ncbi:YibE/F family protein [Staphylococcus felis]|uniref:YibE/F family protein n=1 Tax=Staphylococcus felis TaxID=46127 RepID=A0A3E0IJE4_9STAP|nr:YibE/F family protein [Staphylococcus felis]REH75202.1 YibE/F family protein [Staphylococcus felis]REH83587.1 YibE/F family protein [Staphylococcus felis]REH85782.1 YibE/F family protein [Staphylococcus felis]REH90617.1 YibE/F family protein [Staphylococcus felis]REH93612.1 YibE/F family protein [Staphylococcus felis]
MLNKYIKSNWTYMILVSIIIAIGCIIFTRFNAQFYQSPLGEVTKVTSHQSQKTTDEHHNQDVIYTDTLHIKLLNTNDKGQIVTVKHRYNASKSEAQAYHQGDRVLLHIGQSEQSIYITEKKRDTLVVTTISIFFISLLLVGKKVGLQSIASLIINTMAIILAIMVYQYNPNLNLFLMMSLAVILSTSLTLIFVIGWTKRTVITILSTLLGTFICVGIAWLVITLTHSQGIKYETMNFLTIQPQIVFFASVLIGTLGAVMDVAITISSGMHEILQRSPHISTERWIKAGRNIGRDIMGTMTNILLFSYLAGALPMFLIYLKNGNTLTYSISMNWSLEISRAITGGIGIALTIPITIVLMQVWQKWKGAFLS